MSELSKTTGVPLLQYLTLDSTEFFKFSYIKLSWEQKKNKKDIDVLSVTYTCEKHNGQITECFLIIRCFLEQAVSFGLNDGALFLIYKKKNKTVVEKLKAPSHVWHLSYAEFLSFFLDQQSIQGTESDADNYAEISGIEIRFAGVNTKTSLPFPAKKGCEGVLKIIENSYNSVH